MKKMFRIIFYTIEKKINNFDNILYKNLIIDYIFTEKIDYYLQKDRLLF